jgi:hypothetical protein
MRIFVTTVCVVALAACGDAGPTRPSPVHGAGSGSGGGGGFGSGGVSGLGESGAGAVMGGMGNSGASGGTGGSGQFECPEAQSLPQDGEWTTAGSVIESDCPDIPVGTADTRFSSVTITTADLDGRIDRDLHLVASSEETFRGLVRDNDARISGPLENYPDQSRNISLFMLFAGDCFTAHVREDLMDGQRPCSARYFLQGER